MPRLFTAIEIPPGVAQALDMLRGGLPGARWIDRENYHITLRFIGDVDDVAAREAADALAHIKRMSFDLHIDGLAAFGGRKPRAVVANVALTPALLELQGEQERLMRRIGLEPEPRKYTPHVTLARLRTSSSLDVADYLSARGYFRTAPFPVSRFVLFSSRASTGGGPYVAEASYPLLTASS
jgi:2'-5' RNA ligase